MSLAAVFCAVYVTHDTGEKKRSKRKKEKNSREAKSNESV
jgi:hypothetical protein